MGDDKKVLDGQYPESWDEFVGQVKAIRQLKVAIAGAQSRGERLGHVMLASPHAGIGKTALALLIARALDTTIWIISGTPKPHELRLLFSRMEDGDVLFIDEIHRLADGGGSKSEWLLHYLENGTLMGPLGAEPAPRVTVIGATTDLGKLPRPVRDRFEITPSIVPYTAEEAAGIAKHLATKVLTPHGLPALSDDTALAVSTAAAMSPRGMRRILCAVRDLALAGEAHHTEDGKYDLDEAFDFAGVTEDGLTALAVMYLRVLCHEMGAAPAGAQVLTERLGVVGHELKEVEQLLMDKGLIGKTRGGRVLTGAGLKRADKL